MRTLLLSLLLLVTAVALPVAAQAPAAPRWEVVDRLAAAVEEPQNDHVEVIVRDGAIYVSVPHPAQVKLFTILGQTVAQASIPAGTARIRPRGRGIYILKAGSFTCRVTI